MSTPWWLYRKQPEKRSLQFISDSFNFGPRPRILPLVPSQWHVMVPHSPVLFCFVVSKTPNVWSSWVILDHPKSQGKHLKKHSFKATRCHQDPSLSNLSRSWLCSASMISSPVQNTETSLGKSQDGWTLSSMQWINGLNYFWLMA